MLATRIGWMKSLQGHFLIASPHLGDSNFYKGVVLMIKHDEEGAFGLMLNRPTDNTVGEVWKIVGRGRGRLPAADLFRRARAAGPLVALHRLKVGR